MNYKISKNVKIGKKAQVEDFVILGYEPKSMKGKKVKTLIGDNALIRTHTVIYAGNRIGNDFQTGHQVMIRELNDIGDRVSIGTGSIIEHHVTLGNKVRIHSHAFIPEFSVLEDGCWIGPNVVLTNAPYPLCPEAKQCLKGVKIKKGAKVGANSTLLPGVVIGENALVGAGSVVTKDVPANKIVAGNPARVINDVANIRCDCKFLEGPYISK